MKSAIFSIRNIDIEEINKQVIELLNIIGDWVYSVDLSIDNVVNCGNDDINEAVLPEYLNRLCLPTLPFHELSLKDQIILLCWLEALVSMKVFVMELD